MFSNPSVMVEAKEPISLNVDTRDYEGVKYRIDADCLNKYMKPFTFKRFVACGNNGCIYQICDDHKECQFILKIIHNTLYSPEQEIDLQNKAAEAGLAPKVFKTWECPGEVLRDTEYGSDPHWEKTNLQFLLTEKMDMRQADYLFYIHVPPHSTVSHISHIPQKLTREEINNIIEKLETVILDLHDLGILHGDIYSDNVMVNVDGEGVLTQIKLIDFGQARQPLQFQWDTDALNDDINFDFQYVDQLKREFQ